MCGVHFACGGRVHVCTYVLICMHMCVYKLQCNKLTNRLQHKVCKTYTRVATSKRKKEEKKVYTCLCECAGDKLLT